MENNNLTVKLDYSGILKRIRKEPETIEALQEAAQAHLTKNYVKKFTKEKQAKVDFTIVYQDDSGDYVQVDDQDDLLSAYDWAREMQQKDIKFIISTSEKPAKAPEPKKEKKKAPVDENQITEVSHHDILKAMKQLENHLASESESSSDDEEEEDQQIEQNPVKVSGMSGKLFQQLVKKHMNSNCKALFEKMHSRKDIDTSNDDQIFSKKKYDHEGVHCDACGLQISGVRYKCTVRKNFDVCADCEERIDHPHSFLKIYSKKQVPTAIFTVIDENQEGHADIEQDVKDGPLPAAFQGKIPNPPEQASTQADDDDEDVDLYS